MEDFREIIEYAIEQEIGAQNFYGEIAAKTTRPPIKKMFLELVEEEKRHEVVLRDVLERKEAKLYFTAGGDYGLAETVTAPPPTSEMSLADVFAIAMKNEEAAMKLYLRLAADSTSVQVRTLFEGLANMEQGHKVRMEQFYTDVAFGEAW